MAGAGDGLPDETRRIFLRNYRVLASIGIHDFERAAPQAILINVDLHLEPGGPQRDEIEQVLDYDFLRAEIARLVGARHYNLQETLCQEIMACCLAQPQVVAARVSTEKPNVYPDCEAIGYELFRRRR